MPGKVPVTVLTGFLGSGKTTLMNHLLSSPDHGMRFAVIENEFGEIGVDEHILAEESNEEVIEVMNGCICCTVRGDLVEALKRLHKKVEQFDAVIIETTGLADPAPVAQTFFVDDDIQALYRLDGIITVVDALNIRKRLSEEKPEGVENEAVEQVAFADRLLLNKVDLVDEEELVAVTKELKGINSQAPVVRCSYGKVDCKTLVKINAFELKRALEMDAQFLDTDGEHQHDKSVQSASCIIEEELNLNELRAFIGELLREKGADLYRYKGLLAVKGMKAKFVFQGVGMLFSGNFSVNWKKDEKRVCRFVFIGKNLDRDKLIEGFMDCKAKPLRFNVGDKVTARTGGTNDEPEWTPGVVIRLWDDGNPYRIELDDKQGTNVWGPMDSDEYVRARP